MATKWINRELAIIDGETIARYIAAAEFGTTKIRINEWKRVCRDAVETLFDRESECFTTGKPFRYVADPESISRRQINQLANDIFKNIRM